MAIPGQWSSPSSVGCWAGHQDLLALLLPPACTSHSDQLPKAVIHSCALFMLWHLGRARPGHVLRCFSLQFSICRCTCNSSEEVSSSQWTQQTRGFFALPLAPGASWSVRGLLSTAWLSLSCSHTHNLQAGVLPAWLKGCSPLHACQELQHSPHGASSAHTGCVLLSHPPYMFSQGLHQPLEASRAITPAVVPAGPWGEQSWVLGFGTVTALLPRCLVLLQPQHWAAPHLVCM